MAKLFYDHLVIIEEVIIALSKNQVSKEEIDAVVATVDEMMHHEVVGVVLTHLPRAHHEEFLHKLANHPNDLGLLSFINEKSGKNMEFEIIKTANKVKKKVLREIALAKRKL